MKRRLYIWITLFATALAVPAGYAYVHWSKSGPGSGVYSRAWAPSRCTPTGTRTASTSRY